MVSRGSGAGRLGAVIGCAECVATGGGAEVALGFGVVFVASAAREIFGFALDGEAGAAAVVGAWAAGRRGAFSGTDGEEEPHASRHSPSTAGIERQDTTTTIGVMTATA